MCSSSNCWRHATGAAPAAPSSQRGTRRAMSGVDGAATLSLTATHHEVKTQTALSLDHRDADAALTAPLQSRAAGMALQPPDYTAGTALQERPHRDGAADSCLHCQIGAAASGSCCRDGAAPLSYTARTAVNGRQHKDGAAAPTRPLVTTRR